jgi:hypothetical protein
MHTVTEDVANEIFVNQYTLCTCYRVQVRVIVFRYVLSCSGTSYHVQVRLIMFRYVLSCSGTCYHVQVRVIMFRYALRKTVISIVSTAFQMLFLS